MDKNKGEKEIDLIVHFVEKMKTIGKSPSIWIMETFVLERMI